MAFTLLCFSSLVGSWGQPAAAVFTRSFVAARVCAVLYPYCTVTVTPSRFWPLPYLVSDSFRFVTSRSYFQGSVIYENAPAGLHFVN